MKFDKKYFLGIVMGMGLMSFVIFPENVNAGIVPCGGTGQSQCTICHLAEGIYNIVTLITGILAVTGTLIIVIAGVMYIVSSGDSQMVTTAKTAIKNALIGVIIVLAAWLVITFTLDSVFNNVNSDLDVNEGGLDMRRGSWLFHC
ncbi:MAG: pilin [Candidatus Moraniibacteriota bacterium]|jgi:type IV secretion system pilin